MGNPIAEFADLRKDPGREVLSVTKSLDSVVEVECVGSSGRSGSSTSFSGTEILGRLDEPVTGRPRAGVSLTLFFRLDDDEGPVRTDNGLDMVEGRAGLIDAWAVLTETEAVAGPEAKMERDGVLNNGAWDEDDSPVLVVGI